MTIEQIVDHLRSDPTCAINPAPANSLAIPAHLPEDVRHLFSLTSGGRLFYDPDYPCIRWQMISNPVVTAFIAVSTMPKHYGQVFWLSYSLGDPILTWDQVAYLAPNFTRWLTMHIESWETYRTDWREGLKHFDFLIAQERRTIGIKDA